MYKEYVKWVNSMMVLKLIDVPECDLGDSMCANPCVQCVHNFTELEDGLKEGKSVDDEFLERVREYVMYKMEHGILNPENRLDAYLGVVYLNDCKELGIL